MAEAVVVVTGLPQLQAKLNRLTGPQGVAIRERTITVGARMAVAPIKATAPVRTGALRSSVTTRWSSMRTSGGLRVGTDRNSRIAGPMQHTRYWVTRGTKPRTTRSGAYRGIMPSNPFVDRAWQASGGTIKSAMAQYAVGEIVKLWRA